MSDIFSVIQGTAHISFTKNLVFENLEPLTHSNFVDIKPNFYNKARLAQINLWICEELKSYITLATQGQALALPNFFIEVKGLDSSEAVAKQQACHDDVLSKCGVHEFMAFEVNDFETVYDNDAHTITSIYHSVTDTLQMFVIHQTQLIDSENPSEYYMTQLRSFTMTDTAERVHKRADVFRNARDWAKTQQDKLIAVVNDRVSDMLKETSTLESSTHSMSQSTIEPVAPESETLMNKLFQNVGWGFSLFNKHLKRELKKRSSNPDLKIRLKKSYSEVNSRSCSRGRLLQRQ